MGEPERSRLLKSSPQPPARVKTGLLRGRPGFRDLGQWVPHLPPSCHWAGQAESPSQAEELMGCQQLARVREPAVRPRRVLRLVPGARATSAPIGQLNGTGVSLRAGAAAGSALLPSTHPQPHRQLPLLPLLPLPAYITVRKGSLREGVAAPVPSYPKTPHPAGGVEAAWTGWTSRAPAAVVRGAGSLPGK